MSNGWEIVALFFAVLAIVGFVEFGINAAIFLHREQQLAREGEIVEVSRAFASWFSNVIVHLIIDVIFGAIITIVLELVLPRR